VIGVVGTLAGTAAGLFLCWLQFRFHLIPLPSDIYFIPALPIKIEWLDVVAVDAAAILLCFLATLFPAWQAAKLQPAESIKFEH
jgi:lipoprotein-releasing system permease protein